MDLRIVIEATRQAAQLSTLDQPGEGLIDSSAPRHVEEAAGRENTATPAGAGAAHDPIGN